MRCAALISISNEEGGRILDMKKKTKADVQKIGREFPLQNSMLCAAVLYGYDHGMTI